MKHLVLTLLAWTGFAYAQDLPALYMVEGGEQTDGLNVYETQSERSFLVGTVPSTVRAVEVVQLSDDRAWGMVNFNETSAWVDMKFLRLASDELSPYTPLQCFGNEPFWSLALDDKATSQDITGTSQSFEISERRMTIQGTKKFAYTAAGSGLNLLISVEQALCSDGMSDQTYGLSVAIIQENAEAASVLSGCCKLQNTLTAPPEASD